MKASKPLGIIAISLSLMIGMSACSTGSNTTPADTAVEASATAAPEVVLDRVPEGYVKELSGTPTTEGITALEDGELQVDEQRSLRILGHGITDAISDSGWGDTPANEDEVFHIVTLEVSGQNEIWSDSDDPLNHARVSVDGTFLDEQLMLAQDTSAIVISAPEDAELVLEVKTDSVPQAIDLKTGKRLSEGKADAWYGATAGTMDKNVISEDFSTKATEGKLNFAFDSTVVKTPWTPDDGWADAGNAAWIIVTVDKQPTWTMNGDGSISPGDENHTMVLVDSEGTEFSPVNSDDFGDVLRFEVPVEGDTYTLKTSVTDTVTSWSEKIATFGPVNTESTITFK